MYPNLSYLAHDLIGSPVDNWLSIFQTYGTITTFAIFICSVLLKNEFHRKEINGELSPVTITPISKHLVLFLHLIISGLLFYKLFYVLETYPTNNKLPELLLSSIGSLKGLILGIMIGIAYYYFISKKRNAAITPTQVYPSTLIYESVLFIMLCAMIGARGIAILDTLGDEQSIKSTLIVGGISYYGGLIGGFFGGLLYFRLRKIPVYHLFDTIAPILFLGYCIGRLGCHLSGDGDWGVINIAPKPQWWLFPDWTWAFDFPHNVIKMGRLIPNCNNTYCTQLASPVFPTSLYESILSLIIFVVLWSIKKKITTRYYLTYSFLFIYSTLRFSIEFLRVNPKHNLLGFAISQAQIISLVLFFGTLVWVVIRKFVGRKSEF